MKPESTLDKINSEDRVNDTISRDEETPLNDATSALGMAEDLILQLPQSHEGRREWLRQFGQSAEAKNLREQKDRS